MCFCEEKVTCLYLGTEEQIDGISVAGWCCGRVMGLQAFLGWAVVGDDGLGSVQEESDWRDEDFFSLLEISTLGKK